jgi:activator of HSP90 ATPase
MAIEFVVTTLLSASPDEIYHAWLSSEEHSKMTGSPASMTSEEGGEFIAWDGYIHGKNLELEHGRRIVQSWRTSQFSQGEEDSQIEVILESMGNQTKLTLRHSGLPPHGTIYEEGWEDAYFQPMREYFSSRKSDANENSARTD